MKKLLIVLVSFMMASCAPLQYCQMFQTKPISDIQVRDNALVYEDANCIIYYDFWKEYGEMGFVFYNKTSESIYLHLDECFYVVNGYAFDYYQNRVYTNSKTLVSASTRSNLNGSTHTSSTALGNVVYSSNGLAGILNAYGSSDSYGSGYVNYYSNSLTTSASNGLSVYEKPIITIPSKTGKMITEFNIKSGIYRSCDLLLQPGKKDSNSLSFTKDNSPLTFGNRIAYSVGNAKDLIRVNNEFYVSKIANYEMNIITEMVDNEICGEKQMNRKRVFKESGPDKFYIWYPASTTNKH